MHATYLRVLIVALILALGGVIKGATGMGLPTVAMGLLSLLMTPAEAAAFLIIPGLVTNFWQSLAGRKLLSLLRRIWPMLLMNCLATWSATGLITGSAAGHAGVWLGAALVAYATISLTKIRLSVSERWELWLSPAVGAATGVVTGATGVSVFPAVPYLQALGFDKDDLVQALGLSFIVSTVSFAVGLASHGAFQLTDAGASTLCTLPALIGVQIGQIVRAKVDAATFRSLFLACLLLLGCDLTARSIM
jgi:uncharacterized protein